MRANYFLSSIFIILFSCNGFQSIENRTLGIQPYENFSVKMTDSIIQAISTIYNLKVVVLPIQKLPQKTFINQKSPRYRADSLIRFQKKNLDTLNYILGLTHKDISTTKRDGNGNIKKPLYKYEDWGVMGLAYCPGTSGIVSTFRLKHKNPKVHMLRVKKIVIHELGHNLGLPHCPNKKCVMTDAVESIATIDNAELALCSNCKRKISN
ncbi:matrixin family metalloprotease [Flavobacterium sp. NRK F7]|uniref:matrixin family metalloprotease n=1 Tax=Flavobacterium sp. NRK F7 TaxID=2954930 RepID=UPI0020915A11|nr:matrixin family metalloprotease [Flavobacterium sp. NRK F7]MCO6163326.1 matrixin family metalloprotease [Flavobacterium sp. NRK F7]